MADSHVHPHALGRHLEPNHDPRSWGFQAATAPLVSVRHVHNGPVLDQGNLGSCTGNACAQALNCAPLHDPAKPLLVERDAVNIYERATLVDPVPGHYPPTDTGSDGLSVAKAAKALGLISSYAHAFGLQHTLGALAAAPVIIGVPWHQSMFTPDTKGHLTISGPVEGGHEICLDELDVEHQLVWILNSWGDGWSVHGRASLSWVDLGRLLAQQGDATVLTR